MDVWNFGYRYRVSTLSKASLNVIGIIMQSLKSIGQYKLWGAVKFTYHCPLPPCIGLLLAECLNSPRFPGSISHMHFQTHFYPLSIFSFHLSHTFPPPSLSFSLLNFLHISLFLSLPLILSFESERFVYILFRRRNSFNNYLSHFYASLI